MRKVTAITGEYYHVFNRGVEKRIIFRSNNNYLRMLSVLNFYRFDKPPLRLSYFLRLSPDKQKSLMEKIQEKSKLVEIVCYCLMPNHYHLLIKQLVDGGISTYLGNVQNSYTRYFNTLNKRVGFLFGSEYKIVAVQNESQFIHLSNYIHLNPYSSRLVDTNKDLLEYPWSSLPDYAQEESEMCDIEAILNNFISPDDYINQTLNNKDDQREIKDMKGLLLD